jgi:hypothetical protein
MHTFSTTTRGGGCDTIDEGDLENTWGGLLSRSYSKGGFTLSNGTSIKVPSYKPFAVRKEMKKYIKATDRANFSHPGEITSGWNFCGDFSFTGFYHITGFSEKNILVSAHENCGEWAAARYNCSSVIDMLNLAIEGDVNVCVVRGSEWSIYSQNRMIREMVVFDINEQHISVLKCHFWLLKGKKTLKIDNRYSFNGKKKVVNSVLCVTPPIYDPNFKCTYSWIAFKNKESLFSVFTKDKGAWIENLQKAYPKNILRTYAWFTRGKKLKPGKYEESKWKGQIVANAYQESILTEALLAALKPFRPYYNVHHNADKKTVEISGYENMFADLPIIKESYLGSCVPLTQQRTKDESIAKIAERLKREFFEKYEKEAEKQENLLAENPKLPEQTEPVESYKNQDYIDDSCAEDSNELEDSKDKDNDGEECGFGLFDSETESETVNNNVNIILETERRSDVDNAVVNIIVDTYKSVFLSRYLEAPDFGHPRRPICRKSEKPGVCNIGYSYKKFKKLQSDGWYSSWRDVVPEPSKFSGYRYALFRPTRLPIRIFLLAVYFRALIISQIRREQRDMEVRKGGYLAHKNYKWRYTKMPLAPKLPPVYHANRETIFEQNGDFKHCGGDMECPSLVEQIWDAAQALRPTIVPPRLPPPAPELPEDYGLYQRHFVLGFPIHKTILGETVTDWLLAVIQGRLVQPGEDEVDNRGITMRYGDIIYNDTPVEILTLRHVTDENYDSVGHYYINNNGLLKTLSRKITKPLWSWRNRANRMRGLNPVTGPHNRWLWSPEEQWERFVCSAPVFINALLGPQSDVSLDEELLALSLKRFVYRCTAVNIDPIANAVDNLQHNSFIAAHWALISIKQQFFERSASTLGAFNLPNLKGRPLLL